jgi:hypothetical protein
MLRLSVQYKLRLSQNCGYENSVAFSARPCLFRRLYDLSSWISCSLWGIIPFQASSNSLEGAGASGSERYSSRSLVFLTALLRGSRCRVASHSSPKLSLGCISDPGFSFSWSLLESERIRLGYCFSWILAKLFRVSPHLLLLGNQI